jgi:3D (Asp-Asp-Asp) domain-containing protein
MLLGIKSKMIKFALCAGGSVVLAVWVGTTIFLIIIGLQKSIAFINKSNREFESQTLEVPPHGRQLIAILDEQGRTIREVTAYNVGDPGQTDKSPCLTADGSNACDELARGEKICAANFVPIGTKLLLKGIGICTVKDRMNSRFQNRIDIAMQTHEKDQARKFGLRNLEVRILK